MEKGAKLTSAMKRKISWFLAATAYLGPPIWAFRAFQADAEAQRAAHGWVCGNPLIGIVFLACIASGMLSLSATGFGIASFHASTAPRSPIRLFELALLLIPFLVTFTYALLLFFV